MLTYECTYDAVYLTSLTRRVIGVRTSSVGVDDGRQRTPFETLISKSTITPKDVNQ